MTIHTKLSSQVAMNKHAVSSLSSIVLIDSTVPDYQFLLRGIAPEHEVIVLHPAEDGVRQITQLLATRAGGTASLHIIAHGSPGVIQLGSSVLSSENIAQYETELHQWSHALAPNADILIYGCQVGCGTAGASLIQQIHQLTGATVAAASTLVGDEAQGGSWHLDITTGRIKTPIAIHPDTQQSYAGILNVYFVNGGSSSTNVGEGAGTTVLTVTLQSASANTVTIDYVTANGTAIAPGDYTTIAPSQLTFLPGSQVATVTVTINNDTAVESDEQFQVNFSNPQGDTFTVGATQNFIVNILDNDPLPVVSISDSTVSEADGTITFTVNLSAPNETQAVTVNYSTVDGSASSVGDPAGFIDYVASSGTITFAEGTTQQVVTVTVNEDNLFEGGAGAGNEEIFRLRLTGASGAALTGTGSDTQAIGAINDNDLRPTYSFVNTGISVTEGNNGTTTVATLTVQLTNPTAQTAQVNFAPIDGTATDANNDFEIPAIASLTFQPGVTEQVVQITVNGDNTYENAGGLETFTVQLTGDNAAVNPGASTVATVTIGNDDPVPTVNIGAVTVTEGDVGTTLAIVTATLTNPSDQLITVGFNLDDGTATTTGALNAGQLDYVDGTGTFSFAAGSTIATAVVTINGDTVDEGNESLTVSLGTITGTANPGTNGSVTILDNDATPTISITNASVVEGNAGTTNAIFTVSLSNPSQTGIQLAVNTADGTAVVGGAATSGGVDYAAVTGGTVSFAPGETIQTVTVSVNGDTTFEGNETFNVNLSGITGGTATFSDSQGLGTIGNDDGQPVVSISDLTVAEGGTNAVFTVALTNPSQTAVTLNVNTANVTTATGGNPNAGTSDYTPVVNQSITFAPGATVQLVTVAITDDIADEGDETFNVNLSGVTGATIGDSQAIATITDNDNTPIISISDASVLEGNSGTTNAIFTVTLTNPSQAGIQLSVDTADGTAVDLGTSITGGDDYTGITNGTVSFAPGTTIQTVTVAVNGNNVFEENETFNVNLSGITGGSATLGDSQGVGTIGNDDVQPGVSISDLTVSEGGTNAVFTVSLTNPSQSAVTLTVNTADSTAATGGTANAGTSDYTPVVNQSITFAPGATVQLVTVAITDDIADEGDETFNVNLSGVTGATIGDSQAIATITDNDATPTISITNASVVEGNAGTTNAIFTVSLSNPSQTGIQLAVNTVDGTAVDLGTAVSGGDDYTGIAGGTVSFAPGETVQTVTVAVNGDTTFEGNETFNVNLSLQNGTATFTDSQGLGTIGNDDAQPTISIDDFTVATEGALGTTTTATFTVSLSAPSQSTVTVNYTTANGTAVTGGNAAAGLNDYTATSGTVTFAPGATTATIGVTVNGDDTDEALTETFNVNLSGASGATILDSQGLGTIGDDDAQPQIDITDASVLEGDTGTTTAIFTVTLTNPSQSPVTVGYSTANVSTETGGSLSVGGNDYVTPFTGTLTFAAGSTQQLLTVTVNNDVAANEGNETFNLNLTTPTNASFVIGGNQATGTIGDNDVPPTVSIGDVTLTEGNSGTTVATLTLTLSGTSETGISVNLATADGSATELGVSNTGGNDYEPLVGATASFAPGSTVATVQITVNGDTTDEPNEVFNVNLTGVSAGGVLAADTTGTVTILDNDAAPTITIGNASVLEGADGTTTSAIFTVSLSNPSQTGIQLGVNTVDVTAVDAGVLLSGGDDYTGIAGGVVSFAPGETVQTVTVGINGDGTFEGNEIFNVNLTLQNGTATFTDSQGTGTIGNDDLQPTISITDATVLENAGQAIFTISLTNPSQTAVTLTLNTANVTTETGGNVNAGGSDYTAITNQTVSFAPGATIQLVTVNITDDLADEVDETFNVNLSGLVGASFADSQATGTIQDNDDLPDITLLGTSATSPYTEGGAGATNIITYSFSLSNPSETAVTVNFAIEDNQTTSGADYTATGGTLSFAPGSTVTTFQLTILGDNVYENGGVNETFDVVLSNPVNATVNGGVVAVSATTDAILEDDALPTVNFSSVTVTEGNTGTSIATVSVSLTNPSDQTIVVNYLTTDGSATTGGVLNAGGNDYVAIPGGSVTFAPGQTSATVNVTVNGDIADEPNEAFTVNFNGAGSGNFAVGSTSTITIIDNDATPTISITDASVLEGDTGETSIATFTLTLSNPSSQTVTVNFATADGTGTTGATVAGNDYLANSGVATFAPGTTVTTVTVAVNGDLIFENDETFNVNLTTPTGAAIADSRGVGTIGNDDAQPTVSITDVSVLETDLGTPTTAIFTVSLSNESVRTVTVTYSSSDSTAASPADYQAVGGTLSFAPGTTQQLVTVTVNGDNTFEPNEVFNVNLTGSTNTSAIADSQGVGTIGNNDGQPAISITDASVVEGNSGTTTAFFTVTLSNPSFTTVTVNFATADIETTVGNDYIGRTGTLTFAPGVTSQTLQVTVNGDTTFEPNETFNVNLGSATNATIGDSQGVGAIGNDDPLPSVSIGDLTVSEGGTNAIFTVSLTNPSQSAVTVLVNTADGTATTGGTSDAGTSDYTPVVGQTVSFAPGQTTQLVTVAITDDIADENNETFNVNLSGATGASIVDSQAIATITDNDNAPIISISDASVLEGNAGTTNAIFTVSLSNPSQSAIQVAVNTSDGTAIVGGAAASGGVDYAAITGGTVSFAPGTTTQTITVSVNGDTTFEANETFNVNLSGITGGSATLGDSQGVGTIGNDDAQPTVSIGDVTVLESDGVATFTISLTNPSQSAVTMTLNTADGTAVSGGSANAGTSDYTPVVGQTVSFAPGQTTQVVTVAITDDIADEADTEVFNVNLSGLTGASFGDSQATGTITDNDATPTISITDSTVVEGNSGTTTAFFAVLLSNPSQSGLQLTVNTTDGTAVDLGTAATGGDDYTGLSSTVSFAPGQTLQIVTVSVNGDTTFEVNETFNVNLSGLTGGTAILGDTQGLGTILNDDAQPSVSIGDLTVSEGGTNAIFTVSLTNPSQSAVTVLVNTADGTATTGGTSDAGTSDYTPVVGQTVSFAPGQTTQLVTVAITDDIADENNETFNVNLSGATGASIVDSQAIATITDNDNAPIISISDASVLEGNAGTTNAIFTVSLSNPSQSAIQVAVNTSDGTAIVGGAAASGGVDYAAITGGTVSFAPGTTTQTITVSVNGDTTFEANETFNVNLSGITGGSATLGDSQGVGTIGNDDAQPTISISDASVAEGNAGTVLEIFTVSLSNTTASTVTVGYATANGTATVASGDYLANNGTITFAPGTTEQVVSVTVNGDITFEDNETFNVNLGPATNAGFLDSQGVGTIGNDDSPPTVSIAGTTVTEGDTGTAIASFTVSLSNPNGTPVIINYSTIDATASSTAGIGGNDYVATSGTITFTPGDTVEVINVTVNGDNIEEPDEAFQLQLSGGGLIFDADLATGGITNDDDPPQVSISDVSVVEGDAGTTDAVFAVTLLGATTNLVSIDFTTADGTATVVDGDYLNNAGTLNIQPGETTGFITVQVQGDTLFEDNETFNLNLTSVTGATALDTVGIGTILDNEPPAEYDFGVALTTVTEGNTGTTAVVVEVLRSGETSLGTTLDVVLGSGTPAASAGSDFTAGPINVSFASGETVQSITVEVLGDTTFEQDEEIELSFDNISSRGQAGTTNPTSTITILNDDIQPSTYDFGAATFAENEGNNTNTVNVVTIIRSGGTATTNIVTVSLANGTASNNDYTGGNIRVTFTPGQTSKTVPIEFRGDTNQEPDETIQLSISNVSGTGNVGTTNPTATLTILNDDGVPVYEFSQNTYRTTEGDRTKTVKLVEIIRSGKTNVASRLDLVLDGVDATEGTDFTGGPIQVDFAAGETSKLVPIEILGDTDVEGNEEISLSLANFNRGGVGGTRDTASFIIEDDDAPPTSRTTYEFGRRKYSVKEGNRDNTVRLVEIIRTGNVDVAERVTLELEGISSNPAQPGKDLESGPIRVKFRAGQTSLLVPIDIFGDKRVEENEKVRLTFASFSGDGRVGRPSRTTLVLQNDDTEAPVDNGDRFDPRIPRTPGCQPGRQLAGNGNDNTIRGREGNDVIEGLGGDDRLFGGSCDDRLFGANGDDELFGEDNNDLLYGGTGNDDLNGGDGIDLLVGDSGADDLFGDAGNDFLIGGGGSDTLTGGSGKNTFVYEKLSEGLDTITDFKPGKDLIDLSTIGSIRPRDIELNPTFVVGNQEVTLVRVKGNDLILLAGVNTDDLDIRRDFVL
jgi:Ca2+-binding RTX toxin-like protein